jgi:hypothetical protein
LALIILLRWLDVAQVAAVQAVHSLLPRLLIMLALVAQEGERVDGSTSRTCMLAIKQR